MVKKDKRVIYFIQGATPNEQETAEIMGLGNNVVMRNAQFATESCPEECDAVAGNNIPAAYQGKPILTVQTVPPAPPALPPVVDGWGNPAGIIPPAPPIEA